jgi:uncharacterized membrane protein
MNYWPLLGVLIVVIGFMKRWNPVLVVILAGATAGVAAGMSPEQLLVETGEGFARNRYLAIFLLTLPVLGALERSGLREQAQNWISSKKTLTIDRLLGLYLGVRQLTSALGLMSLGGQAQTVRPLLAPMVEGSAQAEHGPIGLKVREQLRAFCAATDNVGLFFGEDIFIAFGAVLLMQGVYADNGISLEPMQIALWGIPTAIVAFLIHLFRIRRFARNLGRAVRQENSVTPGPC